MRGFMRRAYRGAMASLAGAPGAAQDYPNKTVRVIIPLGAGGGGDIFTRA